MEKITMEYSNLIADVNIQIVDERRVTTPGQYLRGQLVEIDEATGVINKCTLATTVYGIIAEDIDTTTETTLEALVYLSGCFNSKAIIKDVAITDAALKLEARKLAIYIK
ncbi:MAG: hypothetical protein ACRC0V_11280 [Fusobacteriaceae bacterium]